MKRLWIIAVMLMSVGLYASPKKETKADLTAAKNIFIGRVDISTGNWSVLGYASEKDWEDVINKNNKNFQQACQSEMKTRKITGAQIKTDESASDKDLQVKFADVKFDTDSYALYASVHFIDPKSGKEIASIPVKKYSGGHFSVNSCMNGALENLAEKLKEEIEKLPKK